MGSIEVTTERVILSDIESCSMFGILEYGVLKHSDAYNDRIIGNCRPNYYLFWI